MSNFFMTVPLEILLSERQIQKRVSDLAGALGRDFPTGLHLIATLKGASVFLADLIRQIPGTRDDVSIDFITLASYAQGSTTSGEVRLVTDLTAPIQGRDVVIVEDIVDTGNTLKYLQDLLNVRQPRSLSTVCLLNKPSRRRVEVQVDYVGFTIEDRFVVGYGLDYAERYRNLPYIAVLQDLVIQSSG
jgi:hypoxanthine phosphoribosyltransferase